MAFTAVLPRFLGCPAGAGTHCCPTGTAKRAAVEKLCRNQLLMNQLVAEFWAQGWSSAYFEQAREFFPAVQVSDYAVAQQVGDYCLIPGMDDVLLCSLRFAPRNNELSQVWTTAIFTARTAPPP